jgi:hypothetical protein
VSTALIDTLKALPSDPSRVVDLYRQLHAASFLVAVQAGSESDLASALFLTYPARDKIRELPVFTHPDFVLPNLPANAALISAPGPILWPRLLDIVRTGECEAAVDPGQKHGIRLRREMILGMLSQYAA